MSDQAAGTADVETREAVTVDRVAFEEILAPRPGAPEPALGIGNLDLILDVPVPVSVCLGSVRRTISEILALGEGHVVDLDRTAGDPVDLLVNGKLVARGEVVVVENRYGMRITEIVSPAERLAR